MEALHRRHFWHLLPSASLFARVDRVVKRLAYFEMDGFSRRYLRRFSGFGISRPPAISLFDAKGTETSDFYLLSMGKRPFHAIKNCVDNDFNLPCCQSLNFFSNLCDEYRFCHLLHLVTRPYRLNKGFSRFNIRPGQKTD